MTGQAGGWDRPFAVEEARAALAPPFSPELPVERRGDTPPYAPAPSLFLPGAPPDLPDSLDDPIAHLRPSSPWRDPRDLRRRHHDLQAASASGFIVERRRDERSGRRERGLP